MTTSSIKVPDTITKLSPSDTYPVVNGEDVGGFTDLKNEVNSNTSKIETSITNINQLTRAGQTFTYSGAVGPVFPSSQRGNYLVVITNGITGDLSIDTPDPTGGMVDGAVLTIYNESDTHNVILSSSGITQIGSSDDDVTIPPENYVSYVYRLKPDNYIELESGYIPSSKVNMINYIKTTLADQLQTDEDVRKLISDGGYIKGMTIEDTEGHSFLKVNKLIFDDLEVDQDSHGTFTVHVKGGSSGGTSSGIEVDDGTNDVASVTKINVNGMDVTELPSQGGMASGEIELTSGINIHMKAPDQQYGLGLCNELIVESPLEVDDTPTGEFTGRLALKHGVFEPMASPSFLAYMQEPVEVTGKMDIHGNVVGHPKGAVWFDDIVVPSGPYIVTDKVNKAYGIQEADELDPNITGGMNYLVCYRMAFKGKAPNDGFVRIYLKEKQVGTQGTFNYLTDINGHPMAVERFYKAGDELGHLDVIGVVNAKGIKEFQCMTEDSFTDDMLDIEDRENGASGIMIQALKSDDKTGRALLQYMHDTGQDIMFNSHYLGAERMSIKWMTGFTQPIVDLTAGSGKTMADGMTFYPVSNMKVGIQNGHMMFQDNGSDIPDFHFGKVFRADETRMLRGRDVTVKATITDKNAGWNVGLFKWTGKPDEFTDALFTGRQNGSLIMQTNWSLVDKLFISEDAVSGDHTVTKDFTVPADANNYAVVIYPVEASSPMTLELKEFELDVKEPFLGFDIHAPVLDNEKHLVFSDKHKQFVQDVQGYASLRYTISQEDTKGLPMPVGEDKGGNADIELDTTAPVAMVSGSAARGGEGCLKFNSDGNARIVTNLRLWNEQDTDSTVKFWWAEVSADGNTVTKLPDSVFTATVKAGAKGTHYAFGYDHDFESGDRICLRASADKADGAFIEATASVNPMLTNHIEFKELKVADGGDDPWGNLDLSQFDHVYDHQLSGKLVVTNASSVTIPFVIEPNMVFEVKRGIEIIGNIARPLKNLDYSYDYDTHELKVSFGKQVSEARILVGVYL